MPVWATFIVARHCFVREYRHAACPAMLPENVRSRRSGLSACLAPLAQPCKTPLMRAAQAFAIILMPKAKADTSSTPSRFTTGPVILAPAGVATGSFDALCNPAVRVFTALGANGKPAFILGKSPVLPLGFYFVVDVGAQSSYNGTMANTKSARKMIRKIKRRTERNRRLRGRARSFLVRVETAIKEGSRESALEALRVAESNLMRAAARGVFHRNMAARKISRMSKRIHAMGG